MSNRSIKLALPQTEVVELCRVDRIAIYSTEILPLGFTRVYCKTEQGATELRRNLGDFIIKDASCLDADCETRANLSARKR